MLSTIDPRHLDCINSSCRVNPAEQLIAHQLSSLFHGQGQVLNSHLDFASKLLASYFELKVVVAECILELGRVTFIELTLVVEG